MIRTRHACKTFLISRQGPTEREAVCDPEELPAQQALTELPGDPPPALHPENNTQVGLVTVLGPGAVGTGRCWQHEVNDSRHV